MTRRTQAGYPAPRYLQSGRVRNLLTDEQRQRTLVTLSGIVVRQLDAPRDDGEVRDAHS